MNLRKALLATVSSLAFVGGASAADMPVKAPPYIPAWSWTGCYIGAHGAVVSYRSLVNGLDPDFEDGIGGGDSRLTGGGGGQIGCNWQDKNLVYGVEGDATFFRARTAILGFAHTDYWYHTQADWLATLRGRVGITAGTNGATMVYVTGGVAFGGVRSGLLFSDGDTETTRQTRVGWTAGFGAERMLTQNWTVKAEALYIDLGKSNFNNGSYNLNFTHEYVVGKVGLNYKF